MLGRAPDRLPRDGEAVWQLADTGLLYLVQDGARAGNALVTLIVDDLERLLAELGERGLSPSRVDVIPGVGRKAELIDPEGNRTSLAELPQTAVEVASALVRRRFRPEARRCNR